MSRTPRDSPKAKESASRVAAIDGVRNQNGRAKSTGHSKRKNWARKRAKLARRVNRHV